MKNTFLKLIEEDENFVNFINKFKNTANFEVSLTSNEEQRDAVKLCLAYAFIAGKNSAIKLKIEG